MDWEKYNLIPTEFATAREIGLAAATLGAMARRGFVEVLDGSPKKYRKKDASAALTILQLCEENKNDYDEYFHLRKKNEKLFMLCSLKDGIVYDCWGHPYDVADVERVEFRTKGFNI